MLHKKLSAWQVAVVVVLLLSIETEARLNLSLSNIQNTLTKVGRNVKTRVEKINKDIENNTGSSAVQTVISAIETIAESISSITAGDEAGIVSGTIDVISALTSVIPEAGNILSTVFSLLSTILGAVGAGITKDVGSIVKREIHNALNKYDDSNLRAEAEGAVRIYRNSHRFLNSDGEKLEKHEVAALTCNVPVYQNVKFQGILISKIQDAVKIQNVDQAKRAVTYISLYVRLAVLRSAILWQMYSLVRASEHSNFTADAIKRIIEGDEIEDKQALKFLTTPEYDKAIFFQVFNPSEMPDVSKFLQKKGLKLQDLNYLGTGLHTLQPERWKGWYMYMKNDKLRTMAVRKRNGSDDNFHITTISSLDNTFYLRPSKLPWWYVYMENDANGKCRGSFGKPGPQGEWKITRFSDGKYMMSPRKWPNMFIYMKDDAPGTIRGWKGDPGIQGHWIIE